MVPKSSLRLRLKDYVIVIRLSLRVHANIEAFRQGHVRLTLTRSPKQRWRSNVEGNGVPIDRDTSGTRDLRHPGGQVNRALHRHLDEG